jgi:hypothetical protein
MVHGVVVAREGRDVGLLARAAPRVSVGTTRCGCVGAIPAFVGIFAAGVALVQLARKSAAEERKIRVLFIRVSDLE